MDPRHFPKTTSCFGVICSGSTDICISGNCTCGGGPACSGNTNTCTSGTCACGKSPPCIGDATCNDGKCRCDGVICTAPFSNNCISGVCKCGVTKMCSTKSVLTLCLNATGEIPENGDKSATCQVHQLMKQFLNPIHQNSFINYYRIIIFIVHVIFFSVLWQWKIRYL